MRTFLILLSLTTALYADDNCDAPIPAGYNTQICKKATQRQKNVVNLGNQKLDRFLSACAKGTNNSEWCKQVIRPNPDSIDTFRCTYGTELPHQLVHPNEDTWPDAIKAVQLVQQLENQGIKPCIIYNWWRPEPYNANVGGSKTRHPYGTSVDVRFCSLEDMEKAFLKLCEWRAQKKIRAVGYYGTTGLHFGVGDYRDNTWGKECPQGSAVENAQNRSEVVVLE